MKLGSLFGYQGVAALSQAVKDGERRRKAAKGEVVMKCKSCGAEIVWMKTGTGKMIPVDAQTVVNENEVIFNPKTMISHFASCVDAK